MADVGKEYLVTESCGCLFCDLALSPELDENGYGHHRLDEAGQYVDCTRRAVAKIATAQRPKVEEASQLDDILKRLTAAVDVLREKGHDRAIIQMSAVALLGYGVPTGVESYIDVHISTDENVPSVRVDDPEAALRHIEKFAAETPRCGVAYQRGVVERKERELADAATRLAELEAAR